MVIPLLYIIVIGIPYLGHSNSELLFPFDGGMTISYWNTESKERVSMQVSICFTTVEIPQDEPRLFTAGKSKL